MLYSLNIFTNKINYPYNYDNIYTEDSDMNRCNYTVSILCSMVISTL